MGSKSISFALLALFLAMAFVAEAQTCGDRRRTGTEACDNGNSTVDGSDGCFNNCTVNPLYRCTNVTNETSICSPICGDGRLAPEEQVAGACDDNNTRSGDGCSAWCRVERLFACSGVPSRCANLCGNGKLELHVGEQCDTGNTTSTGCSGGCVVLNYISCSNNTPG